MLITSDAEASGRPAKPAVRARNSASAASLLEVLMEGPAKVGKEILMHAYHPGGRTDPGDCLHKRIREDLLRFSLTTRVR